MQTSTTLIKRCEWAAAIFLVLAVGALSYLLLAPRLGFFGDDWYLVYAGQVGGFRKFFDVMASDRPFRGYFVGAVYELFGLKAPLYSYLSYLLRMAQALGAFWLLRLVWPAQSRLAVLLAALFAAYPGWMDQPAPYDYQSHLLAFGLAIFSLAFSLQAARTARPAARVGPAAAALVFEVLYLLLMEYYIGLEGLRLVLLLYIAGPPGLRQFAHGLPERLRRTARLAWPYLAAAAGFLFWRAFLFSGQRAATDIGGIFSFLLGSPLQRGLWSLVYLAQDYLNVTLLAWFVPLYQTAFDLRLRDALVALTVGAVAAALVVVVWRMLRPARDEAAGQPEYLSDGLDLFVIGSLGVLFALIPVALGSRRVIFPLFSRFTLTGSLGAVMVLGGFLIVQRPKVRLALAALLVGLAVTANHANAVGYASSWDSLRAFWWQVSWRAPGIAPDTVLVVDYPLTAVTEDYIVWGPANLIYYPDSYQPGGQIRTPLSSVVLTPENIHDILLGREQPERERRSIVSSQDLGQVLVMAMPEPGACVHVFDGRAPELSAGEDDRIYRIAASSRIDRVLTEVAPRTPLADLFGDAPAPGWCYYYQKASLARQRGNWAEVARLGDEAAARDQRPLDRVEWMPFLQAYAYLGRYDEAAGLAPILAEAPFLKAQACDLFTRDPLGYAVQFPAGQDYLRQAMCR